MWRPIINAEPPWRPNRSQSRGGSHGTFGRQMAVKCALRFVLIVHPLVVVFCDAVAVPSMRPTLPSFTLEVNFDERIVYKAFRDQGKIWLRTEGIGSCVLFPEVEWVHQQELKQVEVEDLDKLIQQIERLNWRSIPLEAERITALDGAPRRRWRLRLPDRRVTLGETQPYPIAVAAFRSLADRLHHIAAVDAAVLKARRDIDRGIAPATGTIGMALEETSGKIMILEVFPGFAADRAGVLRGDELLTIAGHDVRGKTLEDVTRVIDSIKGAEVELTVRRAGQTNALSFTVVRTPLSEMLEEIDQKKEWTEPLAPPNRSKSRGR